MWGWGEVPQVSSTVGDLKNGAGVAEVPEGHGVQEESHAHGEGVQEDHGAEAEAGAGAEQEEVGEVMPQGDPPVQELFVEFVERSLKEILLFTWQSAIKTFHSGKESISAF